MPFDLVVIGSGPGGYSAAVRAGQYGFENCNNRKDAEAGRHMPAGRLHSDQKPAAYRGCLGTFPALPKPKESPAKDPRFNYAKVLDAQEQDRLEALEGRRVPDAEEQGRCHQRGRPRCRAAADRGQERQRHANRGNEEISSGDRFGGANAAGPRAGSKLILTNIEILDLHADSEDARRLSARARWAWSSRPFSSGSDRR